MLDAKLATPNTPTSLSPAEHEKALAELERRMQHLRPAAGSASDKPKAEPLPEVHSAFND